MSQVRIDISVSNVDASGMLENQKSTYVKYDNKRLDWIQVEYLLELIKNNLSDSELCNLFLRLKSSEKLIRR